jgi:hypothetical protein
MPEILAGKFQFYTKAEGLLPWVAASTADPMDKMIGYWTDWAQRLGAQP